MKLLRTVINIYQKQVVQKQILDKVIFVKSLFVCNQQILDLECSHLADHINIIAASFCYQHIFYLKLIVYFEKLVSLYHLAVCR